MIYFDMGDENSALTSDVLKEAMFSTLDKLGKRDRVLIVPPDYTRFHSRAGELTRYVWEYYGDKVKAILPAVGTHYPMTIDEIREMFGEIPAALFVEHDWRSDVATIGTVPAEFVRTVSEGAVDYDWPVQANCMIANGDYDLVLSIGQVVPHEVAGMANHSKNIFIGTGGSKAINKSHFLGAAYGMERIMGRADTPVRAILDYASENYLADMPVVYVQTVVGRADDGDLHVRGMYIGDDRECFERASRLSLRVNLEMLDRPLEKVLVYLDPSEFKSTWLGNKAIYRTRMAIADGGELIILAPGVKKFGEDKDIDRTIRKYGYTGTQRLMESVKENSDLQNNLSAAAHLIHGSSDGRFKVTYCPGGLTREEVESVNFCYADIERILDLYPPSEMKEGMNIMPDGEEVFFISNPAIGLWSLREKFAH